MTIIAVFRSREHSMHYAERLNYYGVPASTVPAPKEARIGCGLCVRFDGRYFTRAQALLRTGRYASFKGFYKMDFVNGRTALFPWG